MIQQYFGLKHIPLAKNGPFLMENPSFCLLKERFQRLLEHSGIGLLTGEAGVGKTASLRHLCASLNPHQYEVLYLAETQFSSFDVYRQIAQNFGLTPHYRFSQLWRDIKQHIRERVENKSSRPILIIDEAQGLPLSFFQSFPSFLNFNFDSQDMLIVWFVGHPELAHLLNLRQQPNTTYNLRGNLKKELRHLRDLGFIRNKKGPIGELPASFQLSDYFELSESGRDQLL